MASIRRKMRCAPANGRQAVGWGADPLDGELTLVGSDGAPHFRAVPTRAGNYVDYYAAVRDAILGHGPNPVPPEQAVALMELLDIGRQSALEGRAIASRAHEKSASAREGQRAFAGEPEAQPPRRIMSKNSTLVLVAFMFLSISSIDSISSMLYMS
jgi:hypothetical protein